MVLPQLRGSLLSVAQIAFIVAPSFILFGYNQAGVGGLLSLPDWTKFFPEIDTTHTHGTLRSHNALLQGLVVATFVLGALVGCIACMYLGDKLGRKKSIFIGGVCSLVGQIICSSSGSISHFVTGRSIIGIAIGIFSSTVPVWQAECSPPAHRGKHVVLDGLFTTFGYTLASWSNLGSSKITTVQSSVTWRLPLAIPCLFSVILLTSIYFVPESPRWLIAVGRHKEATEILSKLKDVSISDPGILAEVASIQSALEENIAKKTSLKDMFTMGPDKLFYRFCLCILLQFYQQMAGANMVSVYAPIIFEQNLDLKPETARLLTGGALTWKFVSSFVAFFTIDRLGRRALFMFSGAGMAISMIVLSIASSFDADKNVAAAYCSVISIFTYNFFVPIGFLGANFLYCAEVAPVSLRVGMAAISTANHWLWNLLVILVTPVAIDTIGHWYFMIFAIISFSIPLSVWLGFPETMGKTLEEIEMLFRENNTIRSTVRESLKGNLDGDKNEENVEKGNETVITKQLTR